MTLPPIECSAEGCTQRIAFYHANARIGLCLEHTIVAPCACGTRIQHCYISGCGEWQPTDLQLGQALYTEFLTDDPIRH